MNHTQAGQVFGSRWLGGLVVALMATGATIAAPAGGGGQQPNSAPPGTVLEAWMDVDRTPPGVLLGAPAARPQRYRAVQLDVPMIRGFLSAAPMDTLAPGATLVQARTVSSPIQLAVPMPDGDTVAFEVVETQVLSPQLAALFPTIKTYRGQCITEGPHFGAPAVFDITPDGFHGQVLSPAGTVYIDPVTKGNINDYATYYIRDDVPTVPLIGCQVLPDAQPQIVTQSARVPTGPTLRTYRLGLAINAEWTAINGGTQGSALSAATTLVNRVSGIYRVELGIALTFVTGPVDNPLALIFTNSATDPYDNVNSNMLSANQSVLDGAIGAGAYDVGHVFGTAGGGVAFLGVVCGASKGGGVSTQQSGQSINYWYVTKTFAHELGHQFSASHTFNTSAPTCSSQRAGSTAVEPGQGSTMMSYGGANCTSSDDFIGANGQNDLYFNSASIDQITGFSANTATCSVNAATGNNPPVVAALTNRAIPLNTPFLLSGSATLGAGPSTGRTLSYSWEQRTVSASAQSLGVDVGTNAINRSRLDTVPTRAVPPLASLIANTIPSVDLLPTIARSASQYPWRLTVRDNFSGGGGVNSANMTVQCVNTGSPFLVSAPNGGEVISSGATTVTWNVAGTTAAPINTANVAILLSTDGGQTYPIVLAASTPNDGSQQITMPAIATSAARIRIEAVNNIFYDISNTNFTIAPPVAFNYSGNRTTVDTIGLGNGNGNGRVDPGEDAVRVNFEVRNDGVALATNVVATLTSLTPTVTVVTGAAAYPDLTANGGTGFGLTPFVIAVSPSHVCGDPINLQLNVSSTQGGGTLPLANLPSGSTGLPITFTYAGPAVAIPDNSTAGVDIAVPVSGLSGTVTSVTFSINGTSCSNDPSSTTVGLNHPVVSSLVGTLFAPSGTNRLLFNRPGGAGNTGSNFCNTRFADDTSLPLIGSINTAGAPYASGFRPVQALTTFNGLAPNGDWRFRIADTAAGNTGSVRAFSIAITTSTPVCDLPRVISAACNPADLCGVGATYDSGAVDIGPDGALTIEDFLNFLSAFGDGVGCPGNAPCNPADLCGVGATYDNGAVDIGPDGQLTIEDFLIFLSAFGDAVGCS